MAQGVPQTSVEAAVESAMLAVQLPAQHMVHHMPQQAPQLYQQPHQIVHQMPQQAQAPQVQQPAQNDTYQLQGNSVRYLYVAPAAQSALQPGKILNC
jgi:FtsZ-interacting cell division protein ZipA